MIQLFLLIDFQEGKRANEGIRQQLLLEKQDYRKIYGTKVSKRFDQFLRGDTFL